MMIIQERTLQEHKKLVEKILKRDLNRQKKIEAAGIEYECPEIVRIIPCLFIDSCCSSYYASEFKINRTGE
jgi:hypothetical protein